MVELSEFLDAELAPLLGFARVLIADRATAEDIVQDVVTKLLARPQRFTTLTNPRAYVRRMIVTEYASWGRRWFRIRPTATLQDDTALADAADIVSDRDELRSLLRQLPPNQRAVLVMRYYLQLADAEIAQTLGCSEGTVRSHASRALSTIRVVPTPAGDAETVGTDRSHRDATFS